MYADIVISNADRHHTEMTLLDKEYQQYSESYWNKKTLAPSAFILYLGIEGKIPELEHHNLIFSKNWNENFDTLFHNPAWPQRPSLYICTPSKTDSIVAPENCENLFVLVPIPAGLSSSETERNAYEQHILEYIAECIHVPDLQKRIKVKKQYGVENFIKDYNAFKGTALGLAHTLGQTAFFRPNNISPRVKNLFFVGAGTNPGIGMPICLLSSELVYKRIMNINHPHPLTPKEVMQEE